MITCPWCGTNYLEFVSNCKNCGGTMPLPKEETVPQADDLPPTPPLAPRPISDRYVWKLLWTDPLAVMSFIFTLLGTIFTLLGVPLTLGILTAFVGLPFALIGLLFLGAGLTIANWRYQEARKIVTVLRDGEAAVGQIVKVEENTALELNGRHPWVIRYTFQALGQAYEGRVSTQNPPGPSLQPGRRACVLYMPDAPGVNALYPHP